MKYINKISEISKPVAIPDSLIVEYTASGPTRPAVPIPAPSALFVILKTIVDTGPRMAAVKVGANQIIGFFTILPI